MSQPIRFFYRGQLQTVTDVPSTQTILQHVREHAHCTGTKEGCAEGDCGACTVVLGQPDASVPGGVALKSVNACIQFLPSLDGQALFTVEDVTATNGGQPHPCQKALVDCHGSQCGFCTPGFVMSLWNLYQHHDHAVSREDAADALSGNLGRCTGYRPILDAAEQMYQLPRVALDLAPVAEALQRLQSDDPGTFIY